MTATRAINIRVTRDQHDRIRENATSQGFKNVSEYVRHRSLEDTLAFEIKFNKLYDTLMNEQARRNPNEPAKRYAEKPVYGGERNDYHTYR